MRNVRTAIGTFCLVALAAALFAQAGTPPAVVSNVKVLSDKVKDVSSLDAWKKSYIKGGHERP